MLESIDEALEDRPGIEEGALAINAWHEAAWAKLAADLDGPDS